jgi:hypothetical protein
MRGDIETNLAARHKKFQEAALYNSTSTRFKQVCIANGRMGIEFPLDARLAVLVASLALLTSIAGLAAPKFVYGPDLHLHKALVPNDAVNVAIGLPVLLLALQLSHGAPLRRGSVGSSAVLAGQLLWPGALFYFAYNFAIYFLTGLLDLVRRRGAGSFVADHEGLRVLAVLLHGLLSVLSAWSLVRLLLRLYEAEELVSLGSRLMQEVSVGVQRWSGAVLALMGGGFALRAVGELCRLFRIYHEIRHSVDPSFTLDVSEIALNISDLVFSPFWLLGGVLLLLGRPLGALLAVALLYSVTMLFMALVAVLLVQPLLISAEETRINLQHDGYHDAAIVAAMSSLTLVPLMLFVNGVMAVSRHVGKEKYFERKVA